MIIKPQNSFLTAEEALVHGKDWIQTVMPNAQRIHIMTDNTTEEKIVEIWIRRDGLRSNEWILSH